MPRSAAGILVLLAAIAFAGPTAIAQAAADAGPPGRLTRPPTLLAAPAPTAPAGLAGVAATVGLLIDLDAEGNVTRSEVVEPAGRGFDEAALAVMGATRFTPAEIDGRPAAIRLRYKVHFPGAGAADAGATDATDAGVSDGAVDATQADTSSDTAAPPTRSLTLRGQARERGTRAPIVGAEISLVLGAAPARVVGETDGDGRFAVTLALPAALGAVRVAIADAEHEPCLRDLPALQDSFEWSCLMPLRRGPSYETVVRTPAPPETPRHALAQAEARSVAGTMGDPLRAVQSLPGVARAPYGLGMLVVRGASPNDSGVFLEGLPVPHLYHFLVGPSVLPAALIDQIAFYPGGTGVRYGRLTAGAVDVTTRRSVAPRLEGNAEISPLDASLLVHAPVAARTSITVGTRRSLIDQILPRLVPDEPGTTFTTLVPRYWDYQLRVLHQLESGGKLGLLAFGSSDDLEVVSADPNRRMEFGNQVAFHRALFSYSTNVAGFLVKLEPALAFGSEVFKGGSDRGEIRYQRLYLRSEVERELHPRFELALGLDGILSRDEADFDLVFPREGRTFGATKAPRARTSRRLNNFGPAAWLEARWRPSDALRIVPGVRVDPYYVFGEGRVSADPRLALSYQLTPALGLRAGAGIFQQLPQPRYLDPEYGNPRLRMVRAEQYYLGGDHQVSDALRASLTLYAVFRHNVPVPSAERMSSLGRARSRGVELMLRHQLARHFYGWIAYTLSKSEQTAEFAEEIEAGMASPRGAPQDEAARGRYRPATFDQTHNLVVVGSYRRASWELGARYRLVSGRPTSPLTGAFADLDFGAHTPQRGAPYSANQPAFSQLDLRVERTFTFDLYRLGVFLDVQNVLNAENPEDILYDYRYRESAPVRGLPILPLLGLRGSF